MWFHAELRDDKLYFEADSDAIITKGIAGLLIRVFSGQTPHDIVNANLDFIDKIGLTQHLSPTRSNGLLSMVKQISITPWHTRENNERYGKKFNGRFSDREIVYRL